MLIGQGSLCRAFVRLLNSTNKYQCLKTLFIVTSGGGEASSLNPSKLFQPGIIFAGKVGSLPKRRAPY
jgi:hypothetical protein